MTLANLITTKDLFSQISSFLSPKDLGRLQQVNKDLKKCVDSVAGEILDMLRYNHQTHLQCLGMWKTIESFTSTINNVNLISTRLLEISGQDKDTAVNC